VNQEACKLCPKQLFLITVLYRSEADLAVTWTNAVELHEQSP